MVEVTLITKPGCHLCDVARPIVERVVADFDAVRLTELDMLQDSALATRWAEDIPVVLVDGTPHSAWRVDEPRLRARLERALAG